jgi:hypothetical protein
MTPLLDRLVLFDVPTPGYPKVVRNWRRYLGVYFKRSDSGNPGKQPVTSNEQSKSGGGGYGKE